MRSKSRSSEPTPFRRFKFKSGTCAQRSSHCRSDGRGPGEALWTLGLKDVEAYTGLGFRVRSRYLKDLQRC